MAARPLKGARLRAMPGKTHCSRQPEIRDVGAMFVSPALQRGVSVPTMIVPESPRDGAFSSHASFQLLRKTERKNTNRGRLL